MKRTLPKLLSHKYLIISVAALLLYTLTGFIALPELVRWYAPRYAQNNLHCLASLEKVRINPFLLTVEINDFSLKQSDGSPLIAFARLFVDLETSSLFRWAVVLRELDLDKPDIQLAFESDGTINFEKLAAASSSPPERVKPDAKPLRFILQGVTISEGRIVAIDRRQSTPAQLSLEKLDIHVKDLSTVKDHNGSYAISATTEAGESLQWQGEVSLAPLRSEGSFSLKAIRAASLWQFIKDKTNLQQPAGQITLTTKYHLDATSSPILMTLDDLKVSLADLSLQLIHADKPFLQLKKVDLDAPHFDLATRQLHVAGLLVEKGAVDVRINETGDLNMQGIIRATEPVEHPRQKTSSPGAQPLEPVAGADQTTPPPPVPTAVTAPPPPAQTAPPFRMNVDAIKVQDVSLALVDQSRKTPITAGIGDIDLSFKAKVKAGEQASKVTLHEISSELKAVNIQSALAPEPLFATEKLTVEGGECDLDTRMLTISRIALNTGRLDVGRDVSGTINWLKALETKGGAGESPAVKPAAKSSPAWKFLVKSFEVDGFSSRFSDLTTPSDNPVVSLQTIKAKISNVDGKSPMDFSLGFQVEQGGTATVSGTVNPSLPSVEAEINVSGMVLTSLQPYIEPYLTLTIESAAVSTHGHLRYGIPKAPQKIAYEGDFSLNDLSLTEADFAKPYLSWDSVQIPKATLTLQPNGLEVQDIKIIQPVGELIIAKDKTLNMARVLKKQQSDTIPPPAKPGQTKEKDVFPYKISRVQVEKGNMIFADLSLRTQFKTRIHDLKGTITGLSSAPDAEANIQMEGGVDKYGTAKISGTIRPNDFGRSSNVDLAFHNLEMKNLSPYSGKFAGRLIKSGKVSADLKYQIHDYKMIGDNKILIDNLVLGKQVDDPDAANLPLDLAIALLQDAQGRIDIGLPVSGDLKDPQFSIGPLIWNTFTNLITKAVTAPFRALGSLFGGDGENFDAVAFDPGSTDLQPPEQEKLMKLADALKKRPQLKLVIQGRYSPEIDGKELKDLTIRKSVATRLGTKLAANEDPGPLDFTDSKTENILEELYSKRFGKASLDKLRKGIATGSVKPRTPEPDQEKEGKKKGVLTKVVDNLELYKAIPGGMSSEQATLLAGELFIRLADSEKVADQSFLQLAGKRAQAIADQLEDQAQISKDRIGIKKPEALADKKPPSAKLSLDAL